MQDRRTPPTTLARRSSLLIVGAALGLAACGDPDSAANTSPLNAIFGEPISPAEERTKQLAQEEAIAACMRAEGWEYTPIDWMAQFNNQPEPDDYTDPDYGKKYGYGIVRNYELYELPYIGEDGQYMEDSPMMGGGFEDPNQDYVMSLSPSEQEQYSEALWGPPWEAPAQEAGVVGDDGEVTVATEVFYSPPLEEQGCQGKARLEVYGEQWWDNAEFSQRMNELQGQLTNDPEIYDAEIVWSDCMYEANPDYDFGGPDDTYQWVSDRLEETKGRERVDVDPNTGEVVGQPGVYPENGYMSNEDNSEAWGYVGKQHPLTEVELEEIRQVELALWRTDQDCLKGTGLQELRRQREQEIVDQLREEFPEFVESAQVG